MGKNSGYLCKIDTGGMCIRKHREQEPEFQSKGKSFVHFINADFTPTVENGVEKSGLIDTTRLSTIGMFD